MGLVFSLEIKDQRPGKHGSSFQKLMVAKQHYWIQMFKGRHLQPKVHTLETMFQLPVETLYQIHIHKQINGHAENII